jgi:hypothetical protein
MNNKALVLCDAGCGQVGGTIVGCSGGLRKHSVRILLGEIVDVTLLRGVIGVIEYTDVINTQLVCNLSHDCSEG